MVTVHIRKHEHKDIPGCGSFEVYFSDGRQSRYYYFEDIPSRRLRPEVMTSEQALEAAKMFARAEREKLGPTEPTIPS